VILVHSLELITTQGIGSLNLREVCRRAGVSNAALYRHFADKTAVLWQIARMGFERLMERFSSAIDLESADPETAILEACRNYLGLASEQPAYLRVMFGGILNQPETPPWLTELSLTSLGQLQSVVERGQKLGRFRAGNPNDLTLACWSAMHGAAMLRIDSNVLPDDEELAGILSETLLRGLA